MGLPASRPERRERQQLESAPRFSARESGHPSLPVRDVVFSANKPVLLRGFVVLGGPAESYHFELALLKVLLD